MKTRLELNLVGFFILNMRLIKNARVVIINYSLKHY